MAFFDEIGKRISQTGQMAVQKTKDMADVAKLNSTILNEEKKIENSYYQIGKLYAELHFDDFDADFEPLFNLLKDSLRNVERLKKEVGDIKGVKHCNVCGCEIANDSTFCSSCGSPIVVQKIQDYENLIECNFCGKKIEKDSKFCTFCGTKIVDISTEENASSS
ncbi:MAG: zinc ribbon domain-containing protein [Clostridiales bacterium]|nr:zinc ribbon domain-containing protein [Clostridiales bacterium]